MNDESMKYRHEYKYVVSESQIAVLKSRIEKLLIPDPNATNGGYNIRSVYFDDYDNRCFYENENGSDPREKFRIRIYDHSDSKITLECKRKERGKTLKTACPLTKEQCELILSGGIPKVSSDNNPLLNKLIIEMLEHKMKPVVIVEYDRIPYIYREGNVRITFDRNLCSSEETKDFLKDFVPKRAVMPKGYHLLEVKFDEFLPDQIYRALNINGLTQTNYSKYYLCRKYTVKGR